MTRVQAVSSPSPSIRTPDTVSRQEILIEPEVIEFLWLWTWHEGVGLPLLARLSYLTCAYCERRPRAVSRLFQTNISGTRYYCSKCAGEIYWRRGVKFSEYPRRADVNEPLLRGNKPESFSGLQFQKHRFEGLHIFKRTWSDNFHCEFHDYEQSQARISEATSRFQGSDKDYTGLSRANRKAKAEMDLWDDEVAKEPPIGFEESIDHLADRTPHLEIGAVVLRRKDRIVTVSVDPPNAFTKPENKCWHGCWLATACRICTPTPVPDDGKGESHWFDRASVFSSVNACDLCGRKMDNWREHYCRECARNLIWTTIEIPISERPNLFGRAAAYQEKKIRRRRRSSDCGGIPAVTFDEVKIYAETILHSQLSERLGMEDLPPVITDRTCLWLLRNCDWLRTLFERFWLYLHGCTLQEIGESESVQRNGVYDFIQRHSSNIRMLFDKLGVEDINA